MERLYQRVGRLIVSLLLIQAVLVVFHLGHFGDVWPKGTPPHERGEFWPVSIYPMFSQGGHPWVRALIRDVTHTVDPQLWTARSFDNLPGRAYALAPRGIDQNDIANFISKTHTWNAQRIAGIRSVFEQDLSERTLLLYRVEGSIDQDVVSVVFVPFLLMTADTTFFNPSLSYQTE